MPVSPFHLYNLIRNPFGELTREERAKLAVVELGDLVELFSQSRTVVQFIGQCGHGKTTHLLAAQLRLPQPPYVYLPESGPHPALPLQRPLIVDEAQRLSTGQLKRVLKIGGPLIFGTHDDLSDHIDRAGMKAVTIDVAGDSSSLRLQEILNGRIVSSRLGNGEVPRISLAHAAQLRHSFGCDVRAVEHYLYEQFQRFAQQGAPWPPTELG